MSDQLWTPGSYERTAAQHEEDVARALRLGRSGVAPESEEAREMRANRRIGVQQRRGVPTSMRALASGGTDISLATARSRDPMFYWRANNVPYDVADPKELTKIRDLCNTPEAPIWMGDYSFKTIGEVVAGDEVIGWEWYETGRGKKSRLVRTRVLATQRRIAPEIVRITMESGRVIRCTPDHQWANPLYSPSGLSGAQYQANSRARKRGCPIPYPPGSPRQETGRTKWDAEYAPAEVGRALRHVIDPTPELASEKERLIGAWLGGLYDGEGSWDGLAQDVTVNPEVRQRIKDSLDFLGIPYHASDDDGRRTIRISAPGEHGYYAKGNVKRQHLVNFLNWSGATRSRNKLAQWDRMLLTSNFGQQDRVVSIESEGPGEVVSMQTETGNYTAWGYASKNCRVLYLTQPVIASAIDIFSRYPLAGAELRCLAGETSVITSHGRKPIASLVDEVHEVLTTGGMWVPAKFSSYGVQRLMRVTMVRNGRVREVYATPEHRWFVDELEGPGRGLRGEMNHRAKLTWEKVECIRDAHAHGATQVALAHEYGVSQPLIGQIVRGTAWANPERRVQRKTPVRRERMTTELRVGDRLTSAWPRWEIATTDPSSFGVVHGMVFGDGALKSDGNGSYIDLYGEKDAQMLPFFPLAKTSSYGLEEGANVEAIRVYDLPSFFKTLPSLDESVPYLYGFLSGWFAADGHVTRRKGECVLWSADRENIEYARTICDRLGIVTYAPYRGVRKKGNVIKGRLVQSSRSMWGLPLDPRCLKENFFHIAHHRNAWLDHPRQRDRSCWSVLAVEETDRVEEVYCAVVPGTEAFALEDHLLTGNCKDDSLTEFYTDHFFDDLNYEDEFFVDFLRECWLVGEAFPMGSFDEDLGVWEDDEFINPNDVDVIRSPFMKEPRFEMKLPMTLRKILQDRKPVWEYNALIRSYPELQHFLTEDVRMPVSNMLMRHERFKGDTFHPRGIPILMRAFRAVIQEEMLNAAQDAIADRLYTPLILVKLGASATDLGTQNPWIPTQDDILEFEEAMDAALAADFRVLTHHFGVKIESFFGRENMPNFDNDFSRLTDRQLMAFGMSRTMLAGGQTGETYAADAINRDLVSQLLTLGQKWCKRHFKQRASIVAEAQGHFDYEIRGGKKYPLMEEVKEVDEDGTVRIVEQPKLLVPELHFKSMNMADERELRQFVEAARAEGVPISMRTRLVNVPVDLDEEIEISAQEQVDQALEAQRVRKRTYEALRAERLPIPEDLMADFGPKAILGPDGQPLEPSAESGPLDTIGNSEPASTEALAPSEVPEGETEGGGKVLKLPSNRLRDHIVDGERSRPVESDEQRARMPKPIAAAFLPPDAMPIDVTSYETVESPFVIGGLDENNEDVYNSNLINGPRHIGLRRYAVVDKNKPMDEQWFGEKPDQEAAGE